MKNYFFFIFDGLSCDSECPEPIPSVSNASTAPATPISIESTLYIWRTSGMWRYFISFFGRWISSQNEYIVYDGVDPTFVRTDNLIGRAYVDDLKKSYNIRHSQMSKDEDSDDSIYFADDESDDSQSDFAKVHFVLLFFSS